MNSFENANQELSSKVAPVGLSKLISLSCPKVSVDLKATSYEEHLSIYLLSQVYRLRKY